MVSKQLLQTPSSTYSLNTKKIAVPRKLIYLLEVQSSKFIIDLKLSLLAYRDEEGLPWVLPVVKTVEAQMSSDAMLNHEYLPIDGLKSFTESATRLVLGSNSPAVIQNRVRDE